MKRISSIVVVIIALILSCFFSYLKGHADALHKVRVENLKLDVSTLKKLEKGKVEWAMSDQALFLWASLRGQDRNSSWLSEWLAWRNFDAKEKLAAIRPEAEALVEKYQHTFLSAKELEAAVGEVLGVPAGTSRK